MGLPSPVIHLNILNLQYDYPQVMVVTHLEDNNVAMTHLYINLTIHDHLLLNCMLDSKDVHNLMPKSIMEKLGLNIK